MNSVTSFIHQGALRSARHVCERYDICSRTLHRWRLNPKLGFPPATVINNRLYFHEAELTAWERKRAVVASNVREG